ncbi:hypothetical protein OQA88_36 [Cercophora sp. LCS_1]
MGESQNTRDCLWYIYTPDPHVPTRRKVLEKPFHERPQSKECFVPIAAPAPTPEPGPDEPTSEVLSPTTDVYMVDFHLNGDAQLADNERYIVGHFSRGAVIESPTPLNDLMEEFCSKA